MEKRTNGSATGSGDGLKFIFDHVPLPPSSNHQYRSFIRGKRIIHVTATETVLFKKSMEAYFKAYSVHLKNVSAKVHGLPLSIHICFYFEHSRLFTKKGTFKRLDVSNRLKAIHDCLARALDIDDSCFVHISAEKRGVVSKLDEHCVIEITAAELVICETTT